MRTPTRPTNTAPPTIQSADETLPARYRPTSMTPPRHTRVAPMLRQVRCSFIVRRPPPFDPLQPYLLRIAVNSCALIRCCSNDATSSNTAFGTHLGRSPTRPGISGRCSKKATPAAFQSSLARCEEHQVAKANIRSNSAASPLSYADLHRGSRRLKSS